MATFSDMATLLLTFFVLLLSFANLDVENFRVALGSVKEALGVQFEVDGKFEAMSTSPVELSDVPASPEVEKPIPTESDAAAMVREFIRKKKMGDRVSVSDSPRGVVLRLKDVVLFDTGSDRLKQQGKPVLDMIAELFRRFDGQLSIEGHTDDRPISTTRFPSNWELSSGRASSVLRYFSEEHDVDMRRMHVAGYAHMHSIASNDAEEGRAKNRRVEFVFEHDAKYAGKPANAFRLPISH
jgi:chemotaxis protein MotB